MVISSIDLLKRKKDPSEHEIREWLEGNICRCTGYHGIVKAVQHCAKNGGAGTVGDATTKESTHA
jgi:carbon-monoxide dehydrogenase small subunit